MNSDQSPCSRCEKENRLNFSFTMAFQPIINCKTQHIFGYEALVRGLHNESAEFILSQVNDDNRYTLINSAGPKRLPWQRNWA
ncbi:MAG: hypothetical protein WBH20_08050 [Oceanisphaera sp.]|uniref:hypothetical protein n=1 Tax=Oceanisphaera sp. TaxID=1929979 RepID=UPI003C74F631